MKVNERMTLLTGHKACHVYGMGLLIESEVGSEVYGFAYQEPALSIAAEHNRLYRAKYGDVNGRHQVQSNRG